jgi:hypothetical protein
VAREVDKRKTGKAMRRLKRVAERAAAEGGPGLTDWEKDFVAGVSERLETYGSAFRDPAKGALDEALSQRQTQVVRALDKKSRPKTKASENPGEATSTKPGPRSTFKRKTPVRATRNRDINDDLAAEPEVAAVSSPPIPPKRGRPALRVIAGGKADNKDG